MKLEAKDISFSYDNGNRMIFNHLHITIKPGERVGLIAPSGFGKTTCCKILAGYEKPDKGQVLLGGKPLSHYKGYCPVQMIWQHPVSYTHLKHLLHGRWWQFTEKPLIRIWLRKNL